MRQQTNRNHDWLSLVSVSGLVVSDPILAEAFPQGPDHVDQRTYRNFIREWERYQQGLARERADAQSRWLRFVFEELLGLSAEHWLRPPSIPEDATCRLFEYEQVLRPSWVLVGDGGRSPLPPGESGDRAGRLRGEGKTHPTLAPSERHLTADPLAPPDHNDNGASPPDPLSLTPPDGGGDGRRGSTADDDDQRPADEATAADGRYALLLSIVPPTQELDRKETQSGKWRASPAVKLERLCRETKVQLGLLTNGLQFRLIVAPPGLSSSHITFDAATWADEKATLDGFFTLLGRDRFLGNEQTRLSRLIADSQDKQLEVTDQLGDQVRHALEDFVRGLDAADRDSHGRLLEGMASDRLYEMSLIVMMRLVFMLYGEENYLLPHGEVLYDRAYGVTHLYTQLAEQRRRAPESMDQTFDAWPRLLATFRLIYEGCTHPDLNLIAYGGKLFDPQRFPMLEDRALRIGNATVYTILRRLCFARGKLGRETVYQRLSYQSLDIEQIGTVYEGLIDYTVKQAPEDDALVLFAGKEQALRPLSEVRDKLGDGDYLREQTGFSASRVDRLLQQPEISDDTPADLPADLLPYSAFIEGVILPGRRYVAHQSGLRKGQGTYYTPKWITSFICERTLEPLAYDEAEEPSLGPQASRLQPLAVQPSAVTPSPLPPGESGDRAGHLPGEGGTQRATSGNLASPLPRRIKSPRDILALKVCDPAMGSGAFLVQACRYLADRLVESWDLLVSENPGVPLTMPFGQPLNGGMREMVIPEDHEQAVTWARRFIAEHCIYGVDLNPLAVELAKMSLWLITLSKDKPFEFFDHKLKHGNSLIGCRTEDLDRYPVAAWDRKGAQGPVKEALKKIKKDANSQAATQDKDRKRGQTTMLRVDVAGLRAETAAEMRQIDDISTFDPQQKERLYRENIEQDSRYQGLKRMFDTWCALWFWPLEGGEVSTDLPLAFAYGDLLNHFAKKAPVTELATEERLKTWSATVRKLWEQERFFHWELEFPEVFEEGREGFDAVVMNPPWDRLKMQEEEFFGARDPGVSSAPNASERRRLIGQLAVDRPDLFAEFQHEKARSGFTSHYFASGGHYPLGAVGDLNYYPLFVEMALSCARTGGAAGMVVPSGIATDYYTRYLFRHLMEARVVRALYDFENREGIFADVDSRMKLCILLLGPEAVADFAFFLTRREHLDEPGRVFSLLSDEIALLNPNTRTCPIFRSGRDADLTKGIYRRVPVLEHDDGFSTWEADVYRAINLGDPALLALALSEDEARDASGLTPPLRVYESKLFHQFDHRFATYQNRDQTYRRGGDAITLPDDRKTDASTTCCPRLWFTAAEVAKRLDGWRHDWLVAFRNVARSTDERTTISSVLPMSGTDYSVRLLVAKRHALAAGRLLPPNLNSFAFDYLARQFIGGANFSDYLMKQLPVIPPEAYTPEQIEFISSRVLELTYTAWDIKAFAEDLGYDGPPFVWDEERRTQLRAQLDALYFHLYGISREDADYILSTFPIVRRKDEARFGTYRTRDLILAYYDAYKEDDMEAWFGDDEHRVARVHEGR